MKKSNKISLTPNHDLLELALAPGDCTWVIGVDEVGAGCLAGPLYCAGVAYDCSQISGLDLSSYYINDSKKLKAAERKSLRNFVESENTLFKSILAISEPIVDKINILQARFKGLSEVALNLSLQIRKIDAEAKIICCVDGDKIPPQLLSWQNQDRQKNIVKAFIKGDSKLCCIALASNYAKDHRDEYMEILSRDFPDYLWEKNVGYGTPEHLSLIERHGLTKHHRRSFCRRFLEPEQISLKEF